ncbi:MAG: ROK family protein [Bifidobacteriaceae bacterium]|nr:ROK family protein [Bifidobacteriaceae bacterium]
MVPDGARLTEPVTAPTPAAAGVTAVASALAPVAAADIGGTKIAVALVTPDGALLTEPVTAPTPAAAGAAGVIQRTVELLRPLVADGAGLVGVSSAGVIDSDTGAVVGATDHIAGWAGTALGPELAQALGCPVRVLGDGHAFAVGEAAFGAGHGLDSVLVVAVGSGVGGSYVRHGRPLTGSHWAGGHLGHVAVPQAEGLPCLCGRTGHVEAVASGWGLLANYRRLGGDRAVPSAKEVCELAGSDSLARQAVETAGAALGAAVGGLANVLDPALVIVAGSLTGAGPLWEAALRGAYLDNLMPVIEQTPLSLAQAGTWPALRGAALYATLVVG